MEIITICVDHEDLNDLARVTSIVFDAHGHPLDDWLDGLCLDIDSGRVRIRWGKHWGDHFVVWKPPFDPVAFDFDGRCYKFCLKGAESLPSTTGEVT